jgi:hypothetical protein
MTSEFIIIQEYCIQNQVESDFIVQLGNERLIQISIVGNERYIHISQPRYKIRVVNC